MAQSPDDAILQSVRCGEPSGEFLDLVVSKVRIAVQRVPSSSGTWTDEEVEDISHDVLAAKWEKITLKVWELHTDRQLHGWMAKVVTNFVNDLGRGTPKGRLRRRIERIIGDIDDIALMSGRVSCAGEAGPVGAHDRDALLLRLWHIPTTTSWWTEPGEDDPTPGDRHDLVALIRTVVTTADGPVDLDLLTEVIAYRLNLPLGWSVGYLEYEIAEAHIEVDEQIPPASREAAARLLAGLNELERRALPVYAENPEVSVGELGRAIGKSKSTGQIVKKSLHAHLKRFAETDSDAEMALRAIGRDVLAGRFDASDRSEPGREEDNDVP